MLAMPTAIQQSHRRCDLQLHHFILPRIRTECLLPVSVIFIYLFHILNYYLGIKQFHNFVRYFVVSAAAERRCHDPRILLLLHTGCCMLHCIAVYSSLYCTRYIYSALYCTKYIYSALYCTALFFCTAQITF